MRLWKSGGLVALLVVMIAIENTNLNQALAAGSKSTYSISNSPAYALPIGGCPILPANNVWNSPINNLPVDSKSDAYVKSIGPSTGLHPDFGSGQDEGVTIGITYTVVPAGQAKVPVKIEYDDESEPGPYPIPANADVEGGPDSEGDRHVLVVEQGTCKLYEMYNSFKQPDNSWEADSGAVFDLNSNKMRPDTWTSADAAGLPILPGLVRYDEVKSGAINHALRFTVKNSQNKYVWPATHKASNSSDTNLPPMGQRFRLKANFDISKFPQDIQVILTAMKNYGMFMADNGSNWFISGAPDERWDNDMLAMMKQVPGSAFEAIDESSLMVAPNSAEAKVSGGTPSTGGSVAGGTPVASGATPPTSGGNPVVTPPTSGGTTSKPVTTPPSTSGGAPSTGGSSGPGSTPSTGGSTQVGSVPISVFEICRILRLMGFKYC